MPVSQTLTVTEVAGSQNIANNTSQVRIVWISTQTGESYNNFTKTAYYWITTPDGVETKYSVSYTLPLATAKTILDKTITVTHKADGTGTVSVRTWMPTGISAGDVELGPKTITLETIERASAITAVGDVKLGNACSVKWIPASASYRYKLKFSLGDWNYTTGAIHPDKTSAFTYGGYKIPLSVANQIPNSKTGKMTVKLYTYSDTAATAQVGDADSATFTVTVPNNDSTIPTVRMTLNPVSSLGSAFDGLYIQGKSKVQATIEATGKYGATITAYRMGIGSAAYDDPLLSDYLNNAGEITVFGAAQDSRGYGNADQATITVMPYSKPQIQPASGETQVVAARCDASGNLDDSGTYLKIKAKRSYNLLAVDGAQKNFCKIQYRYKANGGSYSGWVTILASSSLGSDEVVTGALLGGALALDTTYTVQVQAIDDVGEYACTTITVPTDKVYCHRDGARRAFAFGEYVEEDNTFAIAEDITLRVKGNMHRSAVKWNDLGLAEGVDAPVEGAARMGGGCRYTADAEIHMYVAFNCSFVYSGQAITVSAAKIPEGYRPAGNVFALCPVDGRGVAEVMVNTDGDVCVEFVQDLASGAVTTERIVNWIDGYIDYFL